MKQKQVKGNFKAAKNTHAAKKFKPSKKVEEEVEESADEEEEVLQEKFKKGKKSATKNGKLAKRAPEVVEDSADDEEIVQEKASKQSKNKKVRKVVVEEPSEEEENDSEDDDEEIEENEESDDDEDEEEEEENDDEEEEENDEEEEEENDEEEEEENDEEKAVEDEDVNCEPKESTLPYNVKIGPIPPKVPSARVIHVTRLPENCRQINIIEAFSKYGQIEHIYFVKTLRGAFADVLFKTQESAYAAAADKKAKVLDTPVWIRIINNNFEQLRQRSITVRNLKHGTTVEQISKFFESCGEVELVQKFSGFNTRANVTFSEPSGAAAAFKLHNSILNGVNVGVYQNNEEGRQTPEQDRLTIKLMNKQNFENIDVTKLENIFSKCGEIDKINIICKTNVLSFITFKTEEAVEKALELNGETEEGIELDIKSCAEKSPAIYVMNLPNDCSEKDLTDIFSKAGKITEVHIHNGNAVVRFNDNDGFCKSFLYNQSLIKGKMIFIQPQANRKIFKNNLKRQPIKRPYQNGYKPFMAKPIHGHNPSMDKPVYGHNPSMDKPVYGHNPFMAKRNKTSNFY